MKNFLLLTLSVVAFNTWSQRSLSEIGSNEIVNQSAEAAPSVHNFPMNGSKAIWDIQFSADLGTAASGTNGMAGVVNINNEIWTSLWANDTIIRFTAGGAFIAKFTIAGVTGTRSMTTDGVNIYIGNASNTIYVINPATYMLTGTITSAAAVTSRFLTYDATLNGGAGGFWTGNFNTDIVAINMTGGVLSTISAATHTLTGMYGAAVDNVNPGGPYLWVFHQGGANTSQLTVLSITTGTPTIHTHDAFPDMNTLFGSTTSLAGGAFFSNTFVPGQLSIFTLNQGTPSNAVIVYDASLPTNVSDVAASTIRPTEGYTKIPVTQIFSETFEGNYQNFSTFTAPEINGEFNFYYNSGLVATQTFQATNVVSGGTGTFVSNPFPMNNGVGTYEVRLTVTPEAAATDDNPANDVSSFFFEVTDSIYARDNGVATGTGYTVSAADSAYAATTFEVYASDIATGIWIQLEEPGHGDSTFALIYSTNGGAVNSEVARGSLQIIDSNQNIYYLTFPGGVTLGQGVYAFAVYEGVGVGISLAQSNSVYTAGTNYFYSGGNWTPSGIATARFIRPVFGNPEASLNEKELSELSVYPVPSEDILHIDYAQELSEEGRLTIVDLNGRILISQNLVKGTASTAVDVNALASGSYILNLTSGSTNIVRKIAVK